MNTLRTTLVAGLATLLLAVAGCGGGGGEAFRPTYPDNRSEALSAIAARLAAAPAPAERAVAVALTDEPHRLVAYDVEAGRRLWEQPVSEPRTRPHVAGELVVLHEGDRVVARRLADGARAFDVSDDRFALVGAAGEGALGAIALSTTGGGVGAQSRLLLVRGGGVAGRIDADVAIGEPAVRGGLVFVPWGNQNVSVIEDGAEIARLRSMAGVVGHAVASGDALYFGQAGVGRLGGAVDAGDAASIGWVEPETDALPGGPPLWRSAYDPPAGPRSAAHKVRLAWAPAGGEGGVRFTDDTLYLTFYRLVFGLSPDDLSVRWVHQHDADVVGASARPGGVVLADADGDLTFLGTDGRPRWSAEMGVEPTVVALRLAGFVPSGSPEGEAPPLGDQLLSAVQNTDARLVPARAFAVRQLAALPDEAITARLIVLCDDRSIPAPLREASCEALTEREDGADAVLAALERHAAFLEDTTPPPVGPLATLAARLDEARAVPLLLAHLDDPNTPVEDLPAVAAALAALGDRSAAEPLRDYLWLYHAEATDEAFARGVAAVAAALAELTGPPGRDEVRAIVEAPFTAPTARGLLVELLQRLEEAAEEPPAEEPAEE